MAVEVIKETGAGIENANSYVSIADIAAWVETNPHDSTWAALTDAQKSGYAVMACRVVNEQMAWDGWIINDDQALDLPRSGMVNKKGRSINDDEIPSEVQDAQCELARLFAISDRTADSDTVGFSEISVGSIKLVMDKADNPVVMPSAVFSMLTSFGQKSITKGISRAVRA